MHRFSVLVLVAVLSLVAASCGDDDSDDTTTTAGATTTAAETTSTAAPDTTTTGGGTATTAAETTTTVCEATTTTGETTTTAAAEATTPNVGNLVSASHGTFIVSLIRQTAPNTCVSFASVEAHPKPQFQSWPEGQGGTEPAGWTGAPITDESFVPNHTCYFSASHIFVENGQAEEAIGKLDGAGVVASDGYLVLDEEGEPVVSTTSPEGSFAPVTTIERSLDIITLDPDSPNAFLVSKYLRENDTLAWPVYAIGMAGHWQFKPGNGPVVVDQEKLQEQSGNSVESGVIAVVDTGLIKDESFSWVYEGVTHNGFGDPQLIGPNDVAEIADEVSAAEGIYTIIKRHAVTDILPNVLSLSWGTYPCESPSGPYDVFGLDVALDSWYAAFPGAQVFAAAGNEPPNHGDFYPAAFPNVMGVNALDSSDKPIVWDHDKADPNVAGVSPDAADDTKLLPSADTAAPGCDLVGIAGDPADTAVAWAGSSFATPLAALESLGVDISSAPRSDAPRC